MKTPIEKRIENLREEIDNLELFGVDASEKIELLENLEKALNGANEKINSETVREITGLSRSSVFRKIRNGTFPKPINFDYRLEHIADGKSRGVPYFFLRREVETWVAKKNLVDELNV